MRTLKIALAVACAVGLVACGLGSARADLLPTSAHSFSGAWITDSEMAVQIPRPVKARDLKQHLLPPVKKELGNRHVLFRRAFELSSPRKVSVFPFPDRR